MAEYTCIVCPLSCHLTVSEGQDGTISVSGNGCKRGEEDVYKRQHLSNILCNVHSISLFPSSNLFNNSSRISLPSPMIPMSQQAKIGAFSSVLTAMILRLFWRPARKAAAPDTPMVRQQDGEHRCPDIPIRLSAPKRPSIKTGLEQPTCPPKN